MSFRTRRRITNCVQSVGARDDGGDARTEAGFRKGGKKGGRTKRYKSGGGAFFREKVSPMLTCIRFEKSAKLFRCFRFPKNFSTIMRVFWEVVEFVPTCQLLRSLSRMMGKNLYRYQGKTGSRPRRHPRHAASAAAGFEPTSLSAAAARRQVTLVINITPRKKENRKEKDPPLFFPGVRRILYLQAPTRCGKELWEEKSSKFRRYNTVICP